MTSIINNDLQTKIYNFLSIVAQKELLMHIKIDIPLPFCLRSHQIHVSYSKIVTN